MRVEFRLSNGMLDPVVPGADLKGRPIGEDEVRRFEDWAATYRSYVGRDDRRAELLKLGRELYG